MHTRGTPNNPPNIIKFNIIALNNNTALNTTQCNIIALNTISTHSYIRLSAAIIITEATA